MNFGEPGAFVGEDFGESWDSFGAEPITYFGVLELRSVVIVTKIERHDFAGLGDPSNSIEMDLRELSDRPCRGTGTLGLGFE